MKKLTVVDGTGTGKVAPRPARGISRALYDTVEALGGATKSQIKEYLPAAIDSADQVIRPKRLDKMLYQCVYHGYLIHAGRYWRIAPVDYYNERQRIIAENKEAHKGQGKGGSHPRLATDVTIERPLWHWALVALACSTSFLLGLLLGIWIG